MSNITRALLQRHLSRRGFLVRSSQAAIAAYASTYAGGAFAADVQEITFLNYGGLYGDNQRKAMIDPFTAATGIKVQTPSGPDAIATLVGETKQANASTDVIALSDVQMVTAIAQGGLLAQINPSNVPNAADLADGAKSAPYSYNIEFDPWGILYRTDKMDKPTSWKAIFEPKDASRVAFVRPSADSGSLLSMIAASVIAGGTEDDVLTKGVPVIKALREKGAQFVDYGAGLSLIQNDGADIGTFYNNETFAMADQGLPVDFAFPQEGVFPIGVWLGMPANIAPGRKAVAEKFINWMLSPDPQIAMAKLMYSGPTNKKADVGDALRNKVLSAQTMDRAYKLDLQKVAKLQDSWMEAWNKEIAG
jgi:putative spermidine/putrescine transport system substrate-binding protein